MASEQPKRNVVIIGGGVIGSTTAYFLSHHEKFDKERDSITLLEATRIAGGASGKAGGLLALWAYPSCIVPLSYRLHKELADKHGGTERWGYRGVHCGQLDAQGSPPTKQSAITKMMDQSISLEKRDNRAVDLLRKTGVPNDLDWVDAQGIQAYEMMGDPNTTAQVHPFQFTTSMVQLAEEKGVNIVYGSSTAINQKNGAVTGIKYKEKDTGDEKELNADTIILTAGPWTQKIYPKAPVSALRAHSITIRPTREVSAYCLFTSIKLAKRGGRRNKTVTPEIYARPNNEVYACGEGDHLAPLPATTDLVEVDQGRCEDIVEQVGSISAELRNGEVTARQACYLPNVPGILAGASKTLLGLASVSVSWLGRGTFDVRIWGAWIQGNTQHTESYVSYNQLLRTSLPQLLQLLTILPVSEQKLPPTDCIIHSTSTRFTFTTRHPPISPHLFPVPPTAGSGPPIHVMADLQELFARLGQSSASGTAGNQAQAHNYQQPAVSSPIYSPSPTGPQPHHHSAIISPNTSVANTPAPEMGAQQTPQQQSAQLLNLLRFNSQPNISQTSATRHPSRNLQTPESAGGHGRTISASDLVASFMPKPQAPTVPVPMARPEPASVSSENPQDLLLRLLNQPKPAQSDSLRALGTSFASPPPTKLPETAVDDVAQDLADTKLEKVPSDPAKAVAESPMRIFGSDGAAQSTQFDAPEPVKAPKFTYVNPFDQLAAASPRNRTPVADASKSPAPKMEILKPPHTDTSSHGGKRNVSSDAAPETVADAVTELGQQVGPEVGEALAAVEGQFNEQTVQDVERMSPEDIKDVEQAIVKIAAEIDKEMQDERNVEALEDTLPKPLAEALKEVASDVAHGDVADSWESAADDSPAKDEEDQTVIVYRFPMRAFASITVKEMPPRRINFRSELFMDIARLKKEFDQIDRSLVSATKSFIVYALVKKGGFKIIRQDNGYHRQVFENHHERIFNIALCTAGEESREPIESILGIGVNGSVFWTSLDATREDQFGDDLDTQGLILPPSPSQDDNTSGGQLKTRAKPSSRHPEFFAVGRGKSIHIIWPRVAADYVRGKSRICHTEKYLKERSLKILTGKAGKDFTFSEDDTVIVSLDKAGRMRFWDIRKLTDIELGVPRNPPRQIEVSETLLEFHTTSPTAKSWPTSVFFFDKDKPFNKGIALRYVMVGMKQNHAFQLWDLGLGKAVQEINLPHEKESDAICSVAFHPKTGIMAVAHPTRNSIFFIHVSCPRYNLPVMSQAVYIGRLATKNDKSQQSLPPVNATAIMTSLTEYSFTSKGQIRSLHMLNEPAGPNDVDDPNNNALFELYVMHSKGVCIVRVRRSDLGWKKEGEPLHPKEAEEEGIITISHLKPPQPVADEYSTGGDTPAQKSSSDRSARESIKKEPSTASRQSMTPEAAMRASTLAKVESKQDAARAAIINGSEKSEKKKKKRSAAETTSQTSSATRPPPPSYAQAAQAAQPAKSSSLPETTTSDAIATKAAIDSEAPEWAKKLIDQHFQQPGPSAATPTTFDAEKFEEIVQAEITKGFARELDVMYKRFDEDKRTMNAANGAKHETLLRLVSSTLTENVDKVIKKMVDENVQKVLLPGVVANTTSALEKSISSNLKPSLSKELPGSLIQALRNTQYFNTLPETVAKKVVASLEPIVVASVGSVVNPAIAGLSNLVERQIGDQLREAQAQRQMDAIKISQLTDTVQTLTETIRSMATIQSELQGQLVKIQQHLTHSSNQVASVRASPRTSRSPVKPKQKTPEQLQEEEIARFMSEGNFEQGTMLWLQSNRTSQLFDTVFVRCNPAYLSQVSSLLALSTGAVVTESLDHHLMERLIWLEAVLNNVNPHDAEIRDFIPKIMDVINQRLSQAYMKINESSPGNPLLRRISAMVSKVNELARTVDGIGTHA
ncbi:DAO-domain-containing protein [Lojkania enalia]|uniref:DAO-domain-containing protein n=1 Tax=Lojkania enalia TaxID=147567 RepID=A0A9P4KAV6_9PLEO|nr:DAO-domain-containing protein [Didymosphaeria enalia]